MKEWKEVKLGDFLKIKHGYAFKGSSITVEETDNVLITPGNFHIGGGFKSEKFKYFNNDYPQEYVLSNGDIVVTMTDLSQATDTLGYSAKIPTSSDKIYLHNQRIGLLEFNNDRISKEYIYWLLRTKKYQHYIVSSASGTSIMHTSPTRIEAYDFLLPPLPEQKAIASVLSSLDDKIELLNKQNQTLEQLAETLFRQWFIEEAKEETTIGDIAVIQNGYAFKSKDFRNEGATGIVKIKNITNNIVDINNTDFIEEEVITKIDNRFKVSSGNVLIAMTGAEIGKLGVVGKTNKSLYLNQRVGLLKDKIVGGKYLAYLQLKSDYGQDYIDNTATGSAQPNISSVGIESCPFPKIDRNLLAKYSETINELYQKNIFNQSQIQTLTSLRDTLLPKLINGEVRVV